MIVGCHIISIADLWLALWEQNRSSSKKNKTKFGDCLVAALPPP